MFVSLLMGLMAVANAAEIQTPVQVRTAKGKLDVEVVTLKELKTSEPGKPLRFESDRFKIVKATDEVAISVDCDPELKFRAATVYHHLHLASDYFMRVLEKTQHLKRQTTIRIEMDKDFSNSRHFREPESIWDVRNIAFTIAASDPNLIMIDQPWNSEIWFMKAEKLTSESYSHQVASSLNSSWYRSMLAGSLLYNDLTQVVQSIQARAFDPVDHLISMAFSLGIANAMPTIMELSTRFIKRTYYFDSALVPEAIHHEMGHVALAPWLENRGSTPITEGFPNFFAGEISGLSKIMARGKSRIKGFGSKNSRSQLMYGLDEEGSTVAAHGSFVYTLLTDFHQELGEKGTQTLVRSLNHLNRDSDVANDLTYAVQKAAREVGAEEQAVRNVIRCRFVGCESKMLKKLKRQKGKSEQY
ncbi:MAG: hypothetical protein JNL01_14495 [Bdellovibrionales bacterium]|nr:hypothetical protein [Bdellovibrionales bacterium]